MNTSRFSQNKMSNTPILGSPAFSRLGINSPSAGGGSSKKLRTELRRVMSDRVMKITRCSQQQTVEKIKQKTLINSESENCISQSNLNDSNSKLLTTNLNSSNCLNTTNSSNSFLNNSNGKNAHISINDANNSEENSSTTNSIYKTPTSFTDKSNLIQYLKHIYNECIDKNTPILPLVQEIINSIKVFSLTNNLDLQKISEEILNENLFLTKIQLKQKYKNNETSENLKLESQIQILLQIENYIILNMIQNKVKVDDDFVWEIANSIRFLSQTFKEKFKIEKYLFGEIYSNYFQIAPELIVSLMEELGYDKDDNLEDNNNNNSSLNSTASPSNSILITPNKSPSITKNSNNYSQFNENDSNSLNPITSNSNLFHLLKEESNSNSSFTHVSRVNSLFEDCPQTNEADIFDNDELVPSQNNDEKDRDSDDLLNDFKKKKTTNRFTSFSSTTTTTLRSIVVQSKKRMRLKIRSPCKSPSKSITVPTNKRLIATNDNPRKSPRVKDKQILASTDDTVGKKRPRTYLITDTPDHKQNTTIIRTKQEKIRKRFSFQVSNSNSTFSNTTTTTANQNTLPVIPDTPVKNENRFITASENAATTASTKTLPVINSRFTEIFKTTVTSSTKIYSSPTKLFSPKKNSIFD